MHIAVLDRSGQLEVEVIEARSLTPKPGSKSPPGEAEQLGALRKGPGREGGVVSPQLTSSLWLLLTMIHTWPGRPVELDGAGVGQRDSVFDSLSACRVHGPAHPHPQDHLKGGMQPLEIMLHFQPPTSRLTCWRTGHV